MSYRKLDVTLLNRLKSHDEKNIRATLAPVMRHLYVVLLFLTHIFKRQTMRAKLLYANYLWTPLT